MKVATGLLIDFVLIAVGGAASSGAAERWMEAQFCHAAEGSSDAAASGGQALHEGLPGPHPLLCIWRQGQGASW